MAEEEIDSGAQRMDVASDRVPGMGGGSLPACVFVVGSSRSGTTMMAQILGRHPLCQYFVEMHFFERYWRGMDDEKPLARKRAVDLLCNLCAIREGTIMNAGAASEHVQEAEELLHAIGDRLTPAGLFMGFLGEVTKEAGKKVPVEQTPRNALYLGEILDLYPEARIVNMVRDPRSVVLSKKYMWRRALRGQRNIPWRECVRQLLLYHPLTVTVLWRAAIRRVGAYETDPRILTVRYEDVVGEPERMIGLVCDFVGVEMHPSMLEIPVEGSSLLPDDRRSSGIRTESVAKWKTGGLGRTAQWVCEVLTREERRRLRYTEGEATPTLLGLIVLAVWFPFHGLVGLILATRRARSLRSSIARRLGWPRRK